MRTFAGHLNEKNFIGLANAGQLVACGSESNAVYVYSTHFGRPVASYHFSSQCPLTVRSTFTLRAVRGCANRVVSFC